MGLTSMLSKLWVAQDLFAELQAVSVLLVLVTSLQKKDKSRLYIRHLRPTDLPSAAALILSQPCKVHKKDVFASVLNVWKSSQSETVAQREMEEH